MYFCLVIFGSTLQRRVKQLAVHQSGNKYDVCSLIYSNFLSNNSVMQPKTGFDSLVTTNSFLQKVFEIYLEEIH